MRVRVRVRVRVRARVRARAGARVRVSSCSAAMCARGTARSSCGSRGSWALVSKVSKCGIVRLFEVV